MVSTLTLVEGDRMPASTSFLYELIALFGQPVAENPTQAMHEKAFAARGLMWRYITMEISPRNLSDAVKGLRAMNFAGANCTLPHKVAVIPHLDALTDTARKIGAVNTLIRQKDGSLLGENTDGKGFLQSVQDTGLDIKGVHAVIFGAGGAARAISVELAVAGAKRIVIVNRTAERAADLAAHVAAQTGVAAQGEAWQGAYQVPQDTQLVINATSIALAPNVQDLVPLAYDTLTPRMIACDVIPNPPNTPFLKHAHDAGATTLDGLGMLVAQGAIAFKLWTGQDSPTDVMRQALEEVFAA